jgi:hypothetical protein
MTTPLGPLERLTAAADAAIVPFPVDDLEFICCSIRFEPVDVSLVLLSIPSTVESSQLRRSQSPLLLRSVGPFVIYSFLSKFDNE